METYESMRSATLAALDDDDYETAFRTFRVAIDYTFQKLDGSASQFTDAFGIFARISERFANQEFVARVRSVADQPNDIQRLYDLAYLLYEEGQPGIGATALARADKLAPGQMPIIAELVSALEACGLCAAAVDVLRKYPKLTGSEFVLAYQLAFNSLMSGDLDTTRRTFDTMPGLAARTSDHDVMINRIRGFLTRADQVRQVCPLDLEDLRGWHYVTTGGILTHLSPYGYPDPMRGRFAMTQDSLARIRLGISNLQRVIESKRIPIDSVTPLDDRASQIVGATAAKALGYPLRSWSGGQPNTIVVAYDLSAIDLRPYDRLGERSSGQLLFSHALRWVEPCSIAPDVLSLLHQFNNAPWEPQLRVDPNGGGTTYSAPDDRPPDVIANEILDTSYEADEADQEHPPELSDVFLDAIEPFPPTSGSREIAWQTSPVHSARFL
jgi:hypothetical protein